MREIHWKIQQEPTQNAAPIPQKHRSSGSPVGGLVSLSDMKTSSSKPPCPQCRSTDVVPILYGLPAPEAREEADRGEIALGGCCVSDENPRWHCNDCEHNWGKTRGL